MTFSGGVPPGGARAPASARLRRGKSLTRGYFLKTHAGLLKWREEFTPGIEPARALVAETLKPKSFNAKRQDREPEKTATGNPLTGPALESSGKGAGGQASGPKWSGGCASWSKR